jgi:peroxiredoxin
MMFPKESRLLGLLICTLLLVHSGCKNQATEPRIRLTPDFILLDTVNSEFQLSKHNGQVVLLSFFLTTCAVCQSEVPDLKALYEDYGGEGLTIAGIAVDSADPQRVIDYRRAFDIPFRILLDNGVVSIAYGAINSVPVNVIVNRDGWIVYETEILNLAEARKVIELELKN